MKEEETDNRDDKELLRSSIDNDIIAIITADKPGALATVKQEEDGEYIKRVLRQSEITEYVDMDSSAYIPTLFQPEISRQASNETATYVIEGPTLSVNDQNDRYCNICKLTYRSSENYIHHQRRVHKTITPNIDDPNNYCIACNKTYKDKRNYRRHLFRIHTMDLPEFSNNPININLDNKSNYCKLCDRTYKNRNNYQTHLRIIHHKVALDKISLVVRRNESAPKSSQGPDCVNTEPFVEDKNNHCVACKKTYSDKYEYRKHLARVHSITKLAVAPGPRHVSRNVTPIIENANNHCTACDKKYSSSRSFRSHISRIHGIHLPKLSSVAKNINRNATPVIDGVNNHCTACNRDYVDKHTYRKHLLRVHNITLPKDNDLNK